MWEISQGDVKSSLCYEIIATKRSRKHRSSWHFSLKILFIASLFNESTGIIDPSIIHFCILFFSSHSTNTLEHALIFLQ